MYLQECEPHSYDSNGICTICGASEQPENVNPPKSYKTPDGSTLSRTDWEQITDSTAAMNGSRCQWYAAAGNVLNDQRIEVTGDVNLILCDDAELSLPNGLHVPGGASLTVWTQSAGSGKLTVQSPSMAAGIGGDNGESGGQFTVNGGNITVNGGKKGAGSAADSMVQAENVPSTRAQSP